MALFMPRTTAAALLLATSTQGLGLTTPAPPPSFVVLRSDLAVVNVTVSPAATFVASLALRHPSASPIGCAASSFTTNILGPNQGWRQDNPSGWGAVGAWRGGMADKVRAI